MHGSRRIESKATRTRSLLLTCLLASSAFLTVGGQAVAQTDWDLYMMRLVNRARLDPAGEAARIGSTVVDTSAPVPPLAYDLLIGTAAKNHNDWMHSNLGNVATTDVPDSMTHYETEDGESTGTPHTSSPGYTGVRVSHRLTAVGFSWNGTSENIIGSWSSAAIAVNAARVDANHFAWWGSSGHRTNMLRPTRTAFGHAISASTFTPPLGGLPAPFDNIHFATQNYARPSGLTSNYILGLLYDDLDSSGGWEPRADGDPMREGRAGATVMAYAAGTTTLVGTTTTQATGAFSLLLGDGAYDLEIVVAEGIMFVDGLVVAGANVDAGDLVVDVEPGTPFCFGVGCPCGNDDPAAGCLHSGGVGSVLAVAGGTTSFSGDDLRLDATCPPGNSGLILVNAMGDAPLALFDGLNCVRGGPRVAPGADNGLAQPFGDADLVADDGVRNFGDTGAGLGFVGIVELTFPGTIMPGNTYAAQYWFRDVLCGPPPAPCPTPCGMNANFSNGLMFTVTP